MPNEKKLSVQAQVVALVTIEIGVSSRWGGDCPLEQVFRQAKEEAEARIRGALQAGRITRIELRTVLIDQV